jgi:hypothetical protein
MQHNVPAMGIFIAIAFLIVFQDISFARQKAAHALPVTDGKGDIGMSLLRFVFSSTNVLFMEY